MTDNIDITPGSGKTVRTDDVGGVQVQVVKVALGGDGVEDLLLDSGQQAMAASLPVAIASDQGAVPVTDNGGALTVDGTVAVTSADIATIAGAVAGTEMQVDVLTMPTVTVNAHAVTNAGTFAVQESGAALTALQLIDNCISGAEAQVDVVAALPAGDNNIGNVDIVTVPAPLSTTGGGTEATALRVTLATDSTGVVSVDDNGGALTVDSAQLPSALAANGGLKVEGVAGGTAVPVSGTFYQATQPVSAASLPLPSGAATSALQGGGLPAALGAGGGLKVDGSGTALPVSLASVPSHAVTNAGTFATQIDGAALTALQLIDNCISGSEAQVDVVAALPAGTNLIGKVQPMSALLEGGLTELVGINEQVDQNDYSGSVGVSLGGTYSGEILSVAFYATEDGSGAVQDSAGILYVLDADPSIGSGDTSMSAAARVTVIGKLAIGAADWDTDANGGLAYICNQPIPFHAVSTLYFAWKHLDATSLNDGAGDDEQLEMNFWYRRES